MSITWKELQETCLRKMDSLDGATLTKDSNNAAYLYGMPAAANEALMLLATNGRYWKKLLTITQKKGETATEGEPLGGFLAYDLRQLAEGFYCIDKIKRASGTEYGTYSGYLMEGDHVLLLPAEDGSLWFMEKVAFQEPYRLVKLQNRTELSDYLMEQYDTSWSQDTTRPFIMENDSLMEGYRTNPLDRAA